MKDISSLRVRLGLQQKVAVVMETFRTPLKREAREATWKQTNKHIHTHSLTQSTVIRALQRHTHT